MLTESLGLGTFNFSFPGLVIGSVIYSMPFMVQPLVTAFEGIGDRPMEVAATLRCHPFDAFINVVMPLARPGIITGILMTFAHTIGEFGVVLMIAIFQGKRRSFQQKSTRTLKPWNMHRHMCSLAAC